MAAQNGSPIKKESEGKILMLLQYIDNLFFTAKENYDLEVEILQGKFGDLTAAEISQCFIDASGSVRENGFFKMNCDFLAFYLSEYRMKKAEALMKLAKAQNAVQHTQILSPQEEAQKWAEVSADIFASEVAEVENNGVSCIKAGVDKGFVKYAKNGAKIGELEKIEVFAISIAEYSGHVFTEVEKKRIYNRCVFVAKKRAAIDVAYRYFSAASNIISTIDRYIDDEIEGDTKEYITPLYLVIPERILKKIIRSGAKFNSEAAADRAVVHRLYCDYIIVFLLNKYKHLFNNENFAQHRQRMVAFFLKHYHRNQD